MTQEQTKATVMLDSEDAELLDELTRLEKLSKSDLLRRGIRKLAEEHGIWPRAPRAASPSNSNHPNAAS